MNSMLVQPKWRVIDQSTLGPAFEAKRSFAIDDVLCASVGQGQSPCTARSWVHHNTVILGIQDTRLPFLERGLSVLKSKGYHVVVRNSGGLAVVLDDGVLNLSLIMPENDGRISIDAGYETMTEFIQEMLAPFLKGIEAREIVGSYCPGRYDLSVGGKKFAGISQRRLRHGVAVQIYLSVDGSGSKRAEVVRDFYKAALSGENSSFEYPAVRPEVMASIEELSGRSVSVQDLMLAFYQTLSRYGDLESSQLTIEEVKRFEESMNRVVERNIKSLGHEYGEQV